MDYNPVTANKFCLGTVKLGVPEYGFSSNNSGGEIDYVDFLRLVAETGIQHLDTSPRYGNSEKVIGEYIKQTNATTLISSKVDNLTCNNKESVNTIVNSIKASLETLHVNQLYICYLHQNEIEILADPYIQEGLTYAKDHKYIKHIGASVYSYAECEYALESGIFDFIQVPVNVFDIGFYNRFIKNNITPVRFIARSVLLQGILLNRTHIKSNIKQGEEILKYLENIDKLAAECGLSTNQLALAFTFQLMNFDQFIFGSTSIENIKANIHLQSQNIPQYIREELFNLASVKKDWSNPRNW